MEPVDLSRAAAAPARAIPCRLCRAPATHRFALTMLHRHAVGLYRCTRCASLETEPPHWLDEAYADGRPVRDVWMVGRTERMRALVLCVLRVLAMRDAKLVTGAEATGYWCACCATRASTRTSPTSTPPTTTPWASRRRRAPVPA